MDAAADARPGSDRLLLFFFFQRVSAEKLAGIQARQAIQVCPQAGDESRLFLFYGRALHCRGESEGKFIWRTGTIRRDTEETPAPVEVAENGLECLVGR